MTTETQTIIDRAMSPQCARGQHKECKHSLSYMPDDGNARTMICPCRCHDRAPETGDPKVLYWIRWEYEHVDKKPDDQKDEKVWLAREVLTTQKGIAKDWLDAIENLMQTNLVRELSVMKCELGEWKHVGAEER